MTYSNDFGDACQLLGRLLCDAAKMGVGAVASLEYIMSWGMTLSKNRTARNWGIPRDVTAKKVFTFCTVSVGFDGVK